MARQLYAKNGETLPVKFFPEQTHMTSAARKAVQEQYAMIAAFQ
jgi:hypothetical protein